MNKFRTKPTCELGWTNPKKSYGTRESCTHVICISVKWETTIIEGNNLGCFFTQNQIKPVAEEERCPDTHTQRNMYAHTERNFKISC